MSESPCGAPRRFSLHETCHAAHSASRPRPAPSADACGNTPNRPPALGACRGVPPPCCREWLRRRAVVGWSMSRHSEREDSRSPRLLRPRRAPLAVSSVRYDRTAFFDLTRQLRNTFLDRTRVMHRAELGTAHRAELRALEVLSRQCFVVILLRALRIQTESELLFPVERVASS